MYFGPCRHSRGPEPARACAPEAPGAPGGGLPDAAHVRRLLAQLTARRPLRTPLVPLDARLAQGCGIPYLFGPLEIGLLLSEDSGRLLARVSGAPGGQPLDLEELIARWEAVEARRPGRPKPIAEESEPADSGDGLAPPRSSPACLGARGPGAPTRSSGGGA